MQADGVKCLIITEAVCVGTEELDAAMCLGHISLRPKSNGVCHWAGLYRVLRCEALRHVLSCNSDQAKLESYTPERHAINHC